MKEVENRTSGELYQCCMRKKKVASKLHLILCINAFHPQIVKSQSTLESPSGIS